jgi:hypothetical protein
MSFSLSRRIAFPELRDAAVLVFSDRNRYDLKLPSQAYEPAAELATACACFSRPTETGPGICVTTVSIVCANVVISAELAAQGHMTASGKPYVASVIRTMVAA